MERLFVYGTLMDGAVQKRVLGREVIGVPGCLEGYRMCTIRLGAAVYPIIVKGGRESIRGLVLEVSSADLERLDEYEGAAYRRSRVVLESGVECWVYTG